jgi:hypothetical protein
MSEKKSIISTYKKKALEYADALIQIIDESEKNKIE